ncbi:MAG: hypothetical protein ABSC18_15300, partial [Verrucomicrobiota bacterium]
MAKHAHFPCRCQGAFAWVLGLLWLSSLPASAQATWTWTGSSNSDWFNSGNWSPTGVPASTDTVNVNGTVNFTSHVTFSGQFNWTGGILAGDGLTIATGGVLSINAGAATINLLTALTNAGTVNWLSGNVQVNASVNAGGGPIINQSGGTWNIQCDQSLTCVYNTASDYFQNAGRLEKTVTAGATAFDLPFTNTGPVTVTTGTLIFNSGGTLGGNYSAAAGAAVDFGGGQFTLVSGNPASSGAGQVQFTAGSSILFTSAITNFTLSGASLTGSNFVTGTFNLNSGTLAGSMTVASGALLNWSGGSVAGPVSMASGAVLNWSGGSATGPLTVASGGVLNLNPGTAGTVYLYNALTNAGTVNWLTGDVYVNYSGTGGSTNGGPIVNLAGGLWNISCDQLLTNSYSTATAYFQNAGTVLKMGIGAAQTTINIPFYNIGTVTEQTETLVLNGGGLLGGSFTAALGAAVDFNNGLFTLTNGTLVTNGTGQVQFTGNSTLTFSGGITNFTLVGGETLVGSNFVTGTLNWTGGTVTGPMTVAGGGEVNCTGVTVTSPLTVASNGVLNLSGGLTLNGALTNAGTVNWLGGAVVLNPWPD